MKVELAKAGALAVLESVVVAVAVVARVAWAERVESQHGRELGETLGSGSEQSDEQLKDMLRFAKHDEGAAGGGPLQVTKQELWDCLSRTRLMK